MWFGTEWEYFSDFMGSISSIDIWVCSKTVGPVLPSNTVVNIAIMNLACLWWYRIYPSWYGDTQSCAWPATALVYHWPLGVAFRLVPGLALAVRSLRWGGGSYDHHHYHHQHRHKEYKIILPFSNFKVDARKDRKGHLSASIHQLPAILGHQWVLYVATDCWGCRERCQFYLFQGGRISTNTPLMKVRCRTSPTGGAMPFAASETVPWRLTERWSRFPGKLCPSIWSGALYLGLWLWL